MDFLHALRVILLCALLPTLLYSYIRNRFKPGLRDIPGPHLATWTKLWRLYDVYKGQAHLTAISLHKQYGPLVRIAPNVSSVGDPAMIPVIYNTKGDFTKTAFFPIQSISWNKRPQMNLFSTRDPVEHREQKKKVANAFTLDSLLKSEDGIDECGKEFLDRMHEYASKGEAVDLGAWLQYYSFDVVGHLSFGKKFGFLATGSDVDGMVEAIEGMLVYAANCGQVPELHKFLLGNPLFPIIFPQMETWNQVVMFTLKAINMRTRLDRNGELELKQEDRTGNDMLTKWASVKAADPEKMSSRDAIVHLSGNVFAGSDTTAIALRATFYFLLKNPSKLDKARFEIEQADAAGLLSNPIRDREARDQLPYVNAVIREAMRLHPSVGLLIERHVPAGGAVICGKHIPGHTIVGINPWVLHYDESVFPSAEKFDPERWIDGTPEGLAKMEKSFFPFGAGSRGCIGRHISLIEMRKIVPQLLREFDVEFKNPREEWVCRNVWFVQQVMPEVVLKSRKRLTGAGAIFNRI